MDNKIKQISLKQRYSLEDRDIEEFIEEAYFIQGQDYVDFLAQYGYDVIGFCWGEIRDNAVNKQFFSLLEKSPWLDGKLIMLASEDCSKIDKEGIYYEDITNNPIIKRVSMSLTEFEIRKVDKYKHWEKCKDCNVYAYVTSGELEKDLSMEWIKFLASRYLEYEQYMLDRYKWIKFNACSAKEHTERLIERCVGEIYELQKRNLEKQNKSIEKSDYIINMLTNNK